MDNNTTKKEIEKQVCPLHQKGNEMPEDMFKSVLLSVKKTSEKSNKWLKEI